MSVIVKEPALTEAEMVAQAEKALADIAGVRDGVGRVIFGQESVVERTLVAILAGGHALLVGVPGLAKTKLVETLGVVLGLDSSRIQFTPDLMPSDILGSEVMEQDETGRRSFRFLPGPIFAQLLMADEINRASPRTQSALLQSMQEYHVTVAGHRHDLPKPFHVLATQNPLEQEGTYPLPEAQLDRFLMQVDILYPDLEAERRILIETTGVSDAVAEKRDGPRPAARDPATHPPHAGARKRGRGHPAARSLRPPRPGKRRGRPACRLGSRSPRKPGAHAVCPCPSAL